jgi:thiol-disulfide isomerase/thioredoxin
MKKIISLSISLLLVWQTTTAQEVANFELKNVLSGTTISLKNYSSCEGILLVFTSNTCPYDDYYRSRVVEIAQMYPEKVPILFINALVEDTENEKAMAEKMKALGWSIPYLADKNQTLLNAVGATKSPSFYLLKNNGGKFSVVYKGAFDDNAQVESDVRTTYVKDAIDQLLTKQSISTPEVRPVGCTIRKK